MVTTVPDLYPTRLSKFKITSLNAIMIYYNVFCFLQACYQNYSDSTYIALGESSSATFKQDSQKGLYIEYSKTGSDKTKRWS